MSEGNFVYLTKERLVEIEKELKEMIFELRKENEILGNRVADAESFMREWIDD